MASSADTTRYLIWATVVILGAVAALFDWRWIKRPVCGLLLVAGVMGGVVLTYVSPFDFATGGYYIIGVIISAGSALGLVGYAVASLVGFTQRSIARHGRSKR